MSDVAQNKSTDDAGSPAILGQQNVATAGNTTPSVTIAAQVANSGTTVAGKEGQSNNITNATQNQSPTPRPNPLGYFSSYTYQLSLYMITPEALSLFRQNNRKNIKQLTTKPGGAVLIMQSGGINNDINARPPEFKLDYYIDNLQINSVVSPNDNFMATTTTNIRFQIIEPYGFSFLANLREAAINLMKDSSTLNIQELENSTRQTFVLGVSFQGYDKYGKQFTGKETVSFSNGKETISEVLDPGGSGDGLFENYYDIHLRKVKFKLDGKTTIYDIEAVSASTDLLGVKNGTIPTAISVEATTIDEAMIGPSGLLTLINTYYIEKKLDITPHYGVKFIGNFDKLQYARIVLPSDNNKWRWPIKRDPNDPTGAKLKSPNSDKRIISFSNTPSMSIITAMQKIFTQSTFVYNAFKIDFTSDVTPDDKPKSDPETTPPDPIPFQWFNITVDAKIIGYSKILRDFVYDITYIVAPYDTPTVISDIPKILPKYPGPYKRYEYWYTGKNTEIISYEQQNNNGYFITVLDAGLEQNEITKDTPKAAGLQTGGDNTAGRYKKNEGVGSITTNLYDPKSYSNAKIIILGDPEYLVSDDLNYELPNYEFNKFYAPNGRTINPTGGQVFIEVDFKEGVDYQYGTGTMKINESITFWQYPESIKHLVQGVSFQIRKITSMFKGGKFTQELEMFINLLSEVSFNDIKKDEMARESKTNQTSTRTGTGSPSTTTGNSTTTNTGLIAVPDTTQGPTPSSIPQPKSADDAGTTNGNPTAEEKDAGRQ